MMTEKQKTVLNYLCQNDTSMALLYTDALSEAFKEGAEEGIKISEYQTLMCKS